MKLFNKIKSWFEVANSWKLSGEFYFYPSLILKRGYAFDHYELAVSFLTHTISVSFFLPFSK